MDFGSSFEKHPNNTAEKAVDMPVFWDEIIAMIIERTSGFATLFTAEDYNKLLEGKITEEEIRHRVQENLNEEDARMWKKVMKEYVRGAVSENDLKLYSNNVQASNNPFRIQFISLINNKLGGLWAMEQIEDMKKA